MSVYYLKNESGGRIWCKSHNRAATYIQVKEYSTPKGEVREETPCCDPKLGGILLPCRCEPRTETDA